MVDLSVSLGKTVLKNPVIAASGTFNYGYEFSELYDLNALGGISVKGTTLEPRFGNPTPRIAECAEGMLNSVGLQNPGIEKAVGEELPRLRKVFGGAVILNIGGFSADEFVKTAEYAEASAETDIIELNVSCPNLHKGGENFGTDAESLRKVVGAVRKATVKPLFVKLTPNVTSVSDMAKVCEDEGADGITLINTLLGMRIDIKKRAAVLANKTGGLSGRAIFPVAVRAVYQAYRAVKIPIMGVGGVSCAEDVVEMTIAGATAVQIGAANLVNPYACRDIAESLPALLEKLNVRAIKDIIGETE